jgi:hypothetical protein
MDAGVEESALARIMGPCGLDIGADTQEETALSILATMDDAVGLEAEPSRGLHPMRIRETDQTGVLVKSTDEFSGFASSNSIVPSRSEKRPRTFVSKYRTWNVASEWALSILYVRVVVVVAIALSPAE